MQLRAAETKAPAHQSAALLAGYGFVAAGATLFSTKAIFIKLAYTEIDDASLMLALRMIFSLPFFIGVGIYTAKWGNASDKALPSPALLWRAALTGFIGYYVASMLD